MSCIQIIVPIYNEGENVQVLYRQLISENIGFDSLAFIYDLDSDTSLPYIAKLAEHDSRVRAEKNNFGRGVLNALRWGFSHCLSGPVLVLMGDNSDKLSIIPEMITLWQQGAKIVSPSRYMKGGKQHGGPLLKGLMSRCAGLSLHLLGFPASDPTNNFKLYDGEWLSKQTIESIAGFEIALELCTKCYEQQEKIAQLPTEWFDRTQGESRFRIMKWLPHYLKWYFRAIKAVAIGKLTQ